MQQDIQLSTGRVVAQRYYGNGATEAYIKGSESGVMTNEEWAEYCRIINANN